MKLLAIIVFALIILLANVWQQSYAMSFFPSLPDCSEEVTDEVKAWQAAGIVHGQIAPKLLERAQSGRTFEKCSIMTEVGRVTGKLQSGVASATCGVKTCTAQYYGYIKHGDVKAP